MSIERHKNIVLIGMPGCGKSTIGVLLAKALGFGFIDTDLVIQQAAGKSLQDIVDYQGYLELRKLEEQAVLSLAPINNVIATGGSAVYSKAAVAHLKQLGPLIYLQLDLQSLEKRVGDYSQRGLASDNRHSFNEIYNERCPLYEAAADVVVDCQGLSPDQVVNKIRDIL